MWLVAHLYFLSTVYFLPSSAFVVTPTTNYDYKLKFKDLTPSLIISSDGSRQSLRLFSKGSDLVVSNNPFSDDETNNNNINPIRKPRLASVLETVIRFIVKYVILQQCASLAVDIDTASNRALLQGQVNLSMSIRDCIFRFKLLSLKRLDISGADLRLGYLPIVLPFVPFIVWKLRRFIWSAIFSTLLLQMTGYLETESLRSMIRTVKGRIYNMLRVGPSTINYSMAITEDNVQQSLLLKFWLKGILRSLVENSVVGAAAVFGDVQKDVNAEMKRQRDLRGVPLLPSSSDRNDFGPQPEQQEQGLSSALLSATNFELNDVSFSKGRIVLDAKAVVPINGNVSSGNNQQILPFTIRAKLMPTTVVDGQLIEGSLKQKYNALGFASPECRLNTNPLTSGTILEKLLIPTVVWIPFGVGVAVSLGKLCSIFRADIGSESCRIDGSFTILSPPMQNSSTSANLSKII